MTYQLGIDLGTTFATAALARADRVEPLYLGHRTMVVPSVLYLPEGDDDVVVGDAANRRGLIDPARVAREFKRRLGDPAPILLGGSPFSAEQLTARLLRWIVSQAAAQEAGPPSALALTHPANWRQYKLEVFHQVVVLAGLADALFVAEPVAAAVHYAASERIAPGAIVAVYDLGGGTFDAAVLRRTETGFEVLGTPEGIEHLGGIDFDAAVLAHVDRQLDGAFSALDPTDPGSLGAAIRLRADCVEAKELLSADTRVDIPVLLPNKHANVRLTRSEFETLIRPPLAETVEALRRSLTSAAVRPEDLDRILLVGGSSRIPLVAELLSAGLGRPVAVDAHPKAVVALGAARFAMASQRPSSATQQRVRIVEPSSERIDDEATPFAPAEAEEASPPPLKEVEHFSLSPADGRGLTTGQQLLLLLVAVAVVAIVALLYAFN